ncbi:MAG: VWA domain-containing protein [Proteobacteria bacterium]|nr:VWA domain-containing protein [Pseudomonadota bacterium]
MSFAKPLILIGLFACLPLLSLLFLIQKRYELRLRRLMRSEYFSMLLPAWALQKPLLHWLLLLLGFSAIVIGLARPRFNYEWRDVTRRGADVMIILDVSRSMNAADISPSRLVRAKREITDLLQVVRGDRVGLILFAGVSFIQCPLTQDIKALELFLEQVDSDSIPSQGTSVAQAIRLGSKALQAGAESGSAGKAMILISDGEDQDTDPLLAASEAAKLGQTIHTIAVGGQGAPIPVAEGGFLQDAKGGLVISKPDEASLQAIAKATDGAYIHADTGDFGLDRLYRERIRPGLEEREHTQKEKVWNEVHSLASAVAALCFTAESLLSLWRRRRRSIVAGPKFNHDVRLPQS